ncbi:DMT family transporter [Paraburkholderia sp. Se-20369]|nr:DMT family transporter [Paraburkholderia sp. Se-20369]
MLASLVLLAIAAVRRCWLPPPGERAIAALTGLFMVGGYSGFYFLALDRGMAPGTLATILGVQPILTMMLVERRFQLMRLAGLVFVSIGLALIVSRGTDNLPVSNGGFLLAFAALAALTIGTLLQKHIRSAPADVLPLQTAVGLGAIAVMLPFQPVAFEITTASVTALLWLGIMGSVATTLLFYRLMQRGNLVNVTSLFYLVPIVTMMLDALWPGNRPAPFALLGMAAIIAGLMLVFRTSSTGR